MELLKKYQDSIATATIVLHDLPEWEDYPTIVSCHSQPLNYNYSSLYYSSIMHLRQLLLVTVATLVLASPLKALEANTIEGRLDSSSETLEDNTYYNIHRFEGREGESITIELVSEEFDAFLSLGDAKGNVVAINDDGGEGKNAKIILTLPMTGTYEVIVRTYGAEKVGQYRLTWRESTQDELRLAQADEWSSQGWIATLALDNVRQEVAPRE